MEILAGIGDFLVKIFPVLAGVLIYLIPTAKERLDRKPKVELPIVQGTNVDYTEEYIEELKERSERLEEITRLKNLLNQNSIPYDDPTN